MNDLPVGWIEAPVSQIAIVNPPRPENPVEADALVSFVPMTKVQEESGLLDATTLRPWSEVSKGYTKFQEGDVLFAKITPCMENGKFALAVGLHGGIAAGSTEFHVLRPKSVRAKYLLHFLFHPTVRRNARLIMKGAAGQLRVSGSFFDQLKLPIAPEPEQDRIVAEIEKQFTRLDAATAALKRVQANLKRYRASVLKAACEGRLVPTEAELARKEGRDYEPADKLLQRILRERRSRWEADTLAKMIASGKPPKDDKWREKYKEPANPDTTNLPALPEGWCWAAADQICVQVTDGEHIQPPYREAGCPLLTAKHVQDGKIEFRDFGLIDEEDFVKARLRCAPKEDDVLIVSVGATTGRAGIVKKEPPFAIVRSVLLLRPLVNPLFFLTWAQSPWCQDWIGYASGSTAQAHFYIGDAKRMPVPLAPANEQAAIAQRRDQVISTLDVLESEIRSKLQLSGALRRAILSSAFSGKLVAQDPNDQTASELLESIHAARKDSPPRKSRSPKRNKEPTYA